MVEDTETGGSGRTSLSDSIWGSIILKMAYQRDPQIQKLTSHAKGVSAVVGGSVATVIGGTNAQAIISVTTLNPPKPPLSDSYLPGGIGVGLSGLVNVVFDGGILANWQLRRKMNARQLVIRSRVEAILNHLEHSEAACPRAQSDLAEIIGERAARDCIQLWRSSHATASLVNEKDLSFDAGIKYSANDLVSFDSKSVIGDVAAQSP
jgi:hypothetical protein